MQPASRSSTRSPRAPCGQTHLALVATALLAELVSAPALGECLRQYALSVQAAELEADDRFGTAVAIAGRYALVGAVRDDDGGGNSGAVYVYRWVETDWELEQKLVAPDAAPGDEFGCAVAMSGDVAVVGARLDDDRGNSSGSVYVYRWSEDAGWTLEQKLVASDGAAADEFGAAVALAGDVLVVGVRLDDDLGSQSGSAYVFRWDGQQWAQEAKLLAADGAAGDNFGFAVATDGQTIVSGADRDDDVAADAGAVYLFRQTGGSWQQSERLVAWDGASGDRFGSAVGVRGEHVLVGAHRNDEAANDAGAMYVFRVEGRQALPAQKLLAEPPHQGDQFGVSVAVGESLVIVGAGSDDDAGTNAGAAHLYAWDGDGWVFRSKLLAPDAAAFDQFGGAVALERDYALAGAWAHDAAGTDAGSAYVFDVICWTSCPEDLDGDGRVGVADLSTLLTNFGRADSPSPKQGDVNQDGVINLEDLAALLVVYGTECPV